MRSLKILTLLILAGTSGSAQTSFDLQGHRGGRGLMPEYTIPTFIKAIDFEVTMLESV
jgi:glycerophosphoryl diester phosphodiesterase